MSSKSSVVISEEEICQCTSLSKHTTLRHHNVRFYRQLTVGDHRLPRIATCITDQVAECEFGEHAQ
jgi:hypothetical protein